jgi:hypothetical protein
VLYQCLTGEPPFPGTTLEQVAVGHMVAPPPRASETSNTVPRGLDRVIETGLGGPLGVRCQRLRSDGGGDFENQLERTGD